MSLKEIADALVAHNRAGTVEELFNTLYAADAVSVEGASMGEMGREASGLEAIRGKNDWWMANHELHGLEIDGPHLHGDDRFALEFSIDVSQKSDGARTQMTEIAVYHVAGGKIVREEFFYGPGEGVLAEVAAAVIAKNNDGTSRELLDTLYAADAVSVEAADMGGKGRETVGLAGIHAKHDWWDQTVEMEANTAVGPYAHGDDRFAVRFSAKGTDKETGKPFDVTELAVYHVADGKIVREEFFYAG